MSTHAKYANASMETLAKEVDERQIDRSPDGPIQTLQMANPKRTARWAFVEALVQYDKENPESEENRAKDLLKRARTLRDEAELVVASLRKGEPDEAREALASIGLLASDLLGAIAAEDEGESEDESS